MMPSQLNDPRLFKAESKQAGRKKGKGKSHNSTWWKEAGVSNSELVNAMDRLRLTTVEEVGGTLFSEDGNLE